MKNFYFLLLFVFCVLISNAAFCNTYYLSSSKGDDSRSVLEAQNPSTPWKTLNKLNAFAANLKPGDSVLFKRGDTFYGSLQLLESGSPGKPIVFSAFGPGNKPVICGWNKITGWIDKGKGIWESNTLSYGPSYVNMVVIDRDVKAMGRYPNITDGNKGYLTIQSHRDRVSISNSTLSSKINWTGAELVIRPIRHVLDRCLITSHKGSTLSYAPVSSYEPSDGYGFFIQNSVKTLDQYGEWYYDNKTKKLSVFFGASQPSHHDVRVNAVDILVSGQSRQYINFENLSFKGANKSAFYFVGGSNISIINCNIFYMGEEGVRTQSTSFMNISKTRVNWCNSNGIFIQESVEDEGSNIIRECTIKNIGTFAGMGQSASSTYQGITVNGSKNVVENNVIRNIGYIGIKFGSGNSTIIKNNYIRNFCFIKDDGGGIYTWNNIQNSKGEIIAKIHTGQQIIGNIVMDAGTANEGTIYNESSPIYSERIYGSQGIYLDSYSQNIEVSDNTVVNNGKGIFLHNCKNIKLYNNVVYNNRQRQVDIYNDNVKYPPVRNVKMEGNIFLAGNAIQDIAGFRSERDDIKQFGNFDNNCYGKPVSNINGICVGYIDKNGKKMATIYDADAWTKTFKNDKNKKNLPFTFKEYKLKRVLSSNKYSNGLYNTDISGTSSFSGSGIDVSAWDNSGKLDRGCYKLSYRRNEKGKTTNVIIAVGAIEANKHYILKYSILGTKENRSYGVYLRQGQAPYEDLTPVKYFSLKKTRVDNEVLFSPLISDKNSQIVFKFNNSDDNVYFDNIELKEADVELSNFSDSIRFEFNPTNKIKTIRLSKNYVDINQNKYSGSFQLQPYTSILLFPATVHKKETKTNAIVTKLDSVAADGFLVYPNPASTVLNINLPPAKSKVLLSIFDMGGKSVLNKEYELDYKKRASSSLQMDITSLSKGLYILTVRSSTYHFQEKFIKIE